MDWLRQQLALAAFEQAGVHSCEGTNVSWNKMLRYVEMSIRDFGLCSRRPLQMQRPYGVSFRPRYRNSA
jgi:hypothetical protein